MQRNILLALGRYDYRTHRGVARYAGQHQWHLNCEMASTGRLPRGWRGDGIITAMDVQNDLLRFVATAKVPVVDISLNRQDLAFPRVVGDHYLIGKKAAEHFLERGFRHFAWHAEENNVVSRLRWQGFSDTLALENATCQSWVWKPALHHRSDQWLAKSHWLAQKLLASKKPIAVFAFCDAEAANVLDACLQSNLSVPDEVAIMGVDNNDVICECLQVPLSSVFHDLERVGYESAALLDRILRGEAVPSQPILIPPKGVVARRSTDVLAVHHEPSRKALKFLRENFRSRIGVGDAVKASGIPRRSLDKAFRQEMGRSIIEELTRIRINHSKELLSHSEISIAEIAAASGFNTPQYFNRIFHGLTGMTPRKYRQAWVYPQNQTVL